ncbi:hypothetical protein EP7_005079 [Isosphaeraceae bacterium EP7]
MFRRRSEGRDLSDLFMVLHRDFRELNSVETARIDRLLAVDFPGRDELAIQIQDCWVKSLDENGSLEIQVRSPIKAASVSGRVPAEGECADSDGIVIHYLLHVLDGRVCELEVDKDDLSAVVNHPPALSIQVFSY